MTKILPDVTRILFLRHGEVHPEDCGVLYGQMDVRLSPHGLEQSARAARWIHRNYRLAAVYSSDLQRALHLGKSIASLQGLQPSISPLLRERHFGAWQGHSWEALEQKHPEHMADYNKNRTTFRVPGNGESFQDVLHRVRPLIHELVQRHRGQSIAVTSHGGTLRMVLSDALGIPLTHPFTYDLDYCCLNIVDYRGDGTVRVQLLNGQSHLE